MTARAVRALSWAALVTLAACSDAIIVPVETDAGMPIVDGACRPGDAGTGVVGSCMPRRVPARPICGPVDAGSADGGGDATRWYALQTLTYVAASDQGYDLDGYCTEAMGPAPCDPSTMRAHVVDGPEGIDNAFSSVGMQLAIAYQTILGTDLQMASDGVLMSGVANPLIGVRDYDGRADDPSVYVTLALAVCGSTPGWMGACDDPLRPTPDWARYDNVFYPDDTGFVGSLDMPRVTDDAAFVTRRALVIHLPDGASFRIVTGSGTYVDIGLVGGLMVATLENADQIMRGVIIGRWRKSAILDAARGFGLCPGELPYMFLDTALDGSLDIRDDDDVTGLTCNSVSAAVPFTARQIVIGDLRTGPILTDPCP